MNFSPPAVTSGENKLIKRLVAAASNKIWYENI
jgi:hypothetical protein